MNATYDDPKVRKVYPFADLLREQLKDAVVAARDAVVLRRDAGDPVTRCTRRRRINPQKAINTLQ